MYAVSIYLLWSLQCTSVYHSVSERRVNDSMVNSSCDTYCNTRSMLTYSMVPNNHVPLHFTRYIQRTLLLVEPPPNKGHCPFRGYKCIVGIQKTSIWDHKQCPLNGGEFLYRECPLLEVSTMKERAHREEENEDRRREEYHH